MGAAHLIQHWLNSRSVRTRDAYRRDLEHFAAWQDLDPAAAINQLLSSDPGRANQLVLAWLNAMRAAGLSPATVNRRLSAVRSLVALARLLGRVTWTLAVPGERVDKLRDTRGPGLEGVRRLLAATEGNQALARRNRAILRLLWDLGLRRGELVGLDLEHVDLEAGRLSVLGKGRSGREPLTLPPETAAALRAWIEVRGATAGPLFVRLDRAHRSGSPDRMSATGLYLMVRDLGDQAGVRARPHGVRHAAITTALDRTNGDVRAAARFSRHRDLRTLGVYDDNRQDLGGRVARTVAAAL